MQHEGSLNASPSALGRAFAVTQNLGGMALRRAEKVAQHVSTSVVARDMLSIAHAAGQEKLQYWGFSCVDISKPCPSLLSLGSAGMDRY